MVRERLHLSHLAAAAIVVAVAGRSLVRLEITGDSMLPTLLPGERVVAVRTRRYRRGDLVAVRDPRVPKRLLVKRVASTGPEGVEVRGDNPDTSTDSRQFGLVPAHAVVGRVVYRYVPSDRAGWIQSRR